MDEVLWFLRKTDVVHIAGDINNGLVGNAFVHQCQFSHFESWPIHRSVALGPWLRIPPLSCKFLLRSALPCAGPVRAMISDMLYTDPIQYNHIPMLVSLSICRLDL